MLDAASRQQDLHRIATSLVDATALHTEDALLAQGDSLELIQKLPDRSVSLILTDPPYHSTKKANIVGDRAFEEDTHFLEWMESYARQWQRILKPSGTVYVFCSSEMSARLEVMLSRYLRPIGHITWTKPNEPGYDGWKGKMKKEALRQWYPHSERILMFEHGSYGDWTAGKRSIIGQYLLDARRASGMTMHKLTELTGAYGKVNHGGAVANWEAGRNIPSREQYRKICESLEVTGKVEPMLAYEDLIRPMTVSGDVEFTDTWNFMSVRPFKGKHPAEKPLDLLKHMIHASSYPGDIVLDCFAGSGSTAVAAIELGRRVVAMEIEDRWIERAAKEISARASAREQSPVQLVRTKSKSKSKSESDELLLDGLFD